MPSPFPGMDPYLEHPQLWPDVHLGLIAAMRADLAPRLSPRYVVAVEERTYIAAAEPDTLVGRADVAVIAPPRTAAEPAPAGVPALREPLPVYVPTPEYVTERYLEIRSLPHGEVVTVIEVLSPANKQPGSRGFAEYQAKREAVLATRTSLVEIDLLRAGSRPPVAGEAPTGAYRILVARGWERPRAALYVFGVREPIPAIPIPLRRGEEEPWLDLNGLLHRLYDQAVYRLRIDYSRPPIPPLSPEDAAWAAERIAQIGRES
ncbi:MAG: DUF4058 family protein [Anaerolineae bacterium]|nr:DUF4058 family protein [Anaerolineae bacterium]